MNPIHILYWSQLSFDNIQFNPVFFFHPTLDILPFLEEKNYLNIPILVQNTNGIYDGFYYVNIDRATNIKNVLSDYDTSYPIYSATLNCPFTIFPYEPFIGEFFFINDQFRFSQISPSFISDTIQIEKQKKENLDSLVNHFDPKSIESIGENKIEDETEDEIEDFQIETTPIPPTPSPKTCSPSKFNTQENIYIIIICTFLAMIIILILCFYGDLQKGR